MRRVRIPRAASVELARRYRARAAAESHLVDYLRGLLDARGIPPDELAGFDDETGELLIGRIIVSYENADSGSVDSSPTDTGGGAVAVR